MEAWRAKMNAALGAARLAAQQGNAAAAAAYHQAALNRAVNRGTAQTISNVMAEAPKNPGSIQARPAVQQMPPTPPAPPPSGGGGGPSVTYYSAPSYTPPPPPAPPPPRPPAWITTPGITPPSGVKQADPDIIITADEPISPEFLIQVNYEDLSGMELINISRSDIIDGINVIYSPIKNLSSIRRKYNPNNIISMPELSASYFSRFGIDLVLRGINKPFFDQEGNLVIEIDNVLNDELIEVEISDSGTIDEVEFI